MPILSIAKYQNLIGIWFKISKTDTEYYSGGHYCRDRISQQMYARWKLLKTQKLINLKTDNFVFAFKTSFPHKNKNIDLILKAYLETMSILFSGFNQKIDKTITVGTDYVGFLEQVNILKEKGKINGIYCQVPLTMIFHPTKFYPIIGVARSIIKTLMISSKKELKEYIKETKKIKNRDDLTEFIVKQLPIRSISPKNATNAGIKDCINHVSKIKVTQNTPYNDKLNTVDLISGWEDSDFYNRFFK